MASKKRAHRSRGEYRGTRAEKIARIERAGREIEQHQSDVNVNSEVDEDSDTPSLSGYEADLESSAYSNPSSEAGDREPTPMAAPVEKPCVRLSFVVKDWMQGAHVSKDRWTNQRILYNTDKDHLSKNVEPASRIATAAIREETARGNTWVDPEDAREDEQMRSHDLFEERFREAQEMARKELLAANTDLHLTINQHLFHLINTPGSDGFVVSKDAAKKRRELVNKTLESQPTALLTVHNTKLHYLLDQARNTFSAVDKISLKHIARQEGTIAAYKPAFFQKPAKLAMKLLKEDSEYEYLAWEASADGRIRKIPDISATRTPLGAAALTAKMDGLMEAHAVARARMLGRTASEMLDSFATQRDVVRASFKRLLGKASAKRFKADQRAFDDEERSSERERWSVCLAQLRR